MLGCSIVVTHQEGWKTSYRDCEFIKEHPYNYVARSRKTIHRHETTKIHFFVYICDTHALTRNIKYFITDGQLGLLLKMDFADVVEPRACISQP